MNREIIALLEFIKRAEKLKTELRHSYTSNKDRQESVADHSWMLALMAILMFDYVDLKVDKLKVIKMLIIHDLAEAITGDVPAFEISARNKDKYPAELASMKKLTKGLPKKLADEILSLWDEHEKKTTDEAKLAQCIDKSEALIQHTIADMSTWDEGDYRWGFYNKDEYFDCDAFLRQFKDVVNDQMWQKLVDNNTVHNFNQEHRDRYEIQKSKLKS
jgi:putative hydrolase of HD superfamily